MAAESENVEATQQAGKKIDFLIRNHLEYKRNRKAGMFAWNLYDSISCPLPLSLSLSLSAPLALCLFFTLSPYSGFVVGELRKSAAAKYIWTT